MEESFWIWLTKLVTKNTSKSEANGYASHLTDSEKRAVIRDTESILGRSKKDIQTRFETLAKKIRNAGDCDS